MKLDLLPGEEKIFKRLDSPKKIQDFLNSIPKNFEKTGETCYSPRLVLRENMAHCVEGAFLAASILWYHGEKPLIFDLRSNSEDFDHVKTLREFSVPIDLSKFGTEWITADRNLWDIYFEIDKYRHTPILSRSMISALRKADKIEIEAGKLREWKK